jgi:hypothetical protein
MVATFAGFVHLTVTVVVFSIGEPSSRFPGIDIIEVAIAVSVETSVENAFDLDPVLSTLFPVEEGHTDYISVSAAE